MDSDYTIFVRTLMGRSLELTVNVAMNVKTIKAVITDQLGIPADQQRLMFAGKQLEDEKKLGDYSILKESSIHMVLSLRGGMYHFSSGRQDFAQLSATSAEAVQGILAFELNDISQLSSAELQRTALQAQTVLTNLYRTLKGMYIPAGIPNLQAIMSMPAIIGDDDDAEEASSEH